MVLAPAIAKGRLGREVAGRRARRPAHEARRQLDVLVAAGIAGLAVDDDAPGRVEVDVGVAEEVDVVVAGAQPAPNGKVAGEAVFHLFHHVDERRRLQRSGAQLVVDQLRVGGGVDGAAIEGQRQQLANGQLDARAVVGHLLI